MWLKAAKIYSVEVDGYEFGCYTPARKGRSAVLVRKASIPIQLVLLGLGIGRWLDMDIIAWALIGAAIALTPITIWGDKGLVKFTNWLRTRLNKEKAWLFKLESKQLADLGDYLSTMVHSIDYVHLVDSRLIRVRAELLNLTIFTLDVTRVSLDAECDGYKLGAKTEDNEPKRQSWGMRKQYSLEYHITNTEFLTGLKKAAINRQKLSWNFDIAWDIQTTVYNRRLSVRHRISFTDIPDLSQRQIDAYIKVLATTIEENLR